MLHRLLVAARRRLALDRNPMRRRADRYATWLTALAVLALLAVAPFTGARVADQRLADQAARAHASPTYRVSATVGGAWPGIDSPQQAGPMTTRSALWKAPDGTTRRGTVTVPYRTRARTAVPIWTDAHGRRQEQPRTAEQMRADASAFGGFTAGGVVLGGLILLWIARRILDRRRLARWDEQWALIAPHWMRQY